jgi:hypothetical protein
LSDLYLGFGRALAGFAQTRAFVAAPVLFKQMHRVKQMHRARFQHWGDAIAGDRIVQAAALRKRAQIAAMPAKQLFSDRHYLGSATGSHRSTTAGCQ